MPILKQFPKHTEKRGRVYTSTWLQIECDFCTKVYEKKRRKEDVEKSRQFCSRDCTNKARRKGEEWCAQIEQKAIEQTGYAYNLQNPKIMAKRNQTIHEKYGGPMQQSEEWKQKRKATFLEKYGVDEIFKSEKFKAQREETLIERYGTTGLMKLETFQAKSQETQIERYGNWYHATKEGQDRVKETMLDTYGYHTSFSTQETQDKAYFTIHGYTREQYLEMLPALQSYRNQVWEETRKQPLENLKHYANRGRETYHLDHKFSIAEGFRQGVDPTIIGSVHNLQMLPAQENRKKSDGCSITLEQLMGIIDNENGNQ